MQTPSISFQSVVMQISTTSLLARSLLLTLNITDHLIHLCKADCQRTQTRVPECYAPATHR